MRITTDITQKHVPWGREWEKLKISKRLKLFFYGKFVVHGCVFQDCGEFLCAVP
jgi:hypothetical protein